MDDELRKSFAWRNEVLGGDSGDVKSLKVLNRQISWKGGEIHWEAAPRHVETLARQLGMKNSLSVKILASKMTQTNLQVPRPDRLSDRDHGLREVFDRL